MTDTCRQGHPFTPENTIRRRNGSRTCRRCVHIAVAGRARRMPTCSVNKCGRRQHAKGFCAMHYRRWAATGSTERRQLTLADRLWAKVDKDGPVPLSRPELGQCWVWTAFVNNTGYGHISLGGARGRKVGVHRVAYELMVGPIPEGLTIDHLCRNRLCVNPSHLEPVTLEENIRRTRRTHCMRGHALTPENTTRLRRECRICGGLRSGLRWAREAHERFLAERAAS